MTIIIHQTNVQQVDVRQVNVPRANAQFVPTLEVVR